MNKADLINEVAGKTGLSKRDVELAVNALFDAVTAALARGDKVQIVGFGSFEVKARAARTGRNPKTGESVAIPAARAAVFKAGKGLKDALAG